MLFYKVLQYLLLSVAFLLIGYQLLLGVFSLMPHSEARKKQGGFNHSFLFLIHVNSPDQEIVKTLYSLYGLVYPSNLFDLLVIADNCPHKTVEDIRKLGTKVIERKYTGKTWEPGLLSWIVEQLKHWKEEYDAIVVIEPGVLISGNFLEIMNAYLQNGSLVLQSSSLNVPVSGAWKFKFSRTLLLNSNHINSLGRSKIGMGTRLVKNGTCFKISLLEKMPLELFRAINNEEYNLPLLMKGIRIDFVPEAVVWTTASNSFLQFDLHKTERERRTIKKYLSHFVTHFVTHKSVQDFDTIVDSLTPSVRNQFIGTGTMTVINGALWIFAGISSSYFWLWLMLFTMVTLYLLIGLVTDRAICLAFNRDTLKGNQTNHPNAVVD